ncbi:hypothetical protein ACRAWF_42470 [Streptomyces sp. L7]
MATGGVDVGDLEVGRPVRPEAARWRRSRAARHRQEHRLLTGTGRVEQVTAGHGAAEVSRPSEEW